MKFLTALFVGTAFSIVPVLAQSTTTTTTIPFGSRGTRTIVQSSDGSSLTSTTQQFRMEDPTLLALTFRRPRRAATSQ